MADSPSAALPVVVEAVSAGHLPSLRALFEAASCPCYCRYWHFTGTKNDWLDRCASHSEENATELESAVRESIPGARGLVAVEGREVVGWMKLALRDHLPKLRMLPVYRSLDLGDGSVTLSIACMLVHPRMRGRGVARALVHAAPSIAREWGAHAVEGYPRRASSPLHAEEAWQGPESVFVEAGFEAVHDVAPYPVYRFRVDRSQPAESAPSSARR